MTAARTYGNQPDQVRNPKPGTPANAGTGAAPDPDFVEAAQPPPPAPAGDGGSEGDDPPSQDITPAADGLR
jgi:hypothetical protein